MLADTIAAEPYCYLTTTGRVSGRAHKIEIWFAVDSSTLYLLAGGRDRAGWVRNVRAHPEVRVRLAETTLEVRARLVDSPEEDALARRLLLEKYQPGYANDLTEWGRTALPVAIDLDGDGAERRS